jgi:hypothetical protein
MQGKEENEENEREKPLLGEKKEVSSKSGLTGPTLLEMFGNPTNRS